MCERKGQMKYACCLVIVVALVLVGSLLAFNQQNKIRIEAEYEWGIAAAELGYAYAEIGKSKAELTNRITAIFWKNQSR